MAKHGDDRSGNLVWLVLRKSQDEFVKLIAADGLHCDECIDLCNTSSPRSTKKRDSPRLLRPKPANQACLDQYVIGQEREEDSRRPWHNHTSGSTRSSSPETWSCKSRTSCGSADRLGRRPRKTLARFLQVPFTIADRHAGRKAGYVERT